MADGPYYKPGTYAGKITEQGLGQSKEKGTPYFFLKFTVIGTAKGSDQMIPFGGDVQQYERTAVRYITEGTIDMLTEDLEQIGFSGTSFSKLEPSNPSHQSFVGDVFPFYCKHEFNANDGKTYERWQLSRPLGGGMEVKPVDANMMRGLDAQFGSKLKQIKRGIAPAARPAHPPSGVSFGVLVDDDVPF